MRMRHKPYARPELAAWDYNINNPSELKGRWATAFAEPSLPLRLELGCGKGGFLAQQAVQNPEFNHLGLDIKSEVLVVAKRTIEAQFAKSKRPISNVLITSCEIELMENILSAEDAVERVFINFCNPWYKSGHAKHRLTHPRQLVHLRHVMRPNAEIWFKTDDERLYKDTLRYFPIAGFEITWRCEDLHAQEPAWNIRTEHEKMFSEMGISIKACVARMADVPLNEQAILRMKNI